MILTEIILAGGVALVAATALILADSIRIYLWPNAAMFQSRWPIPRYAGGPDALDSGYSHNRSDESRNERLLVSDPVQASVAPLQLRGLDLLDNVVFSSFILVVTAEYAVVAWGQLGRAWANLPLMDRFPILILLIKHIRHWITVVSLLGIFG